MKIIQILPHGWDDGDQILLGLDDEGGMWVTRISQHAESDWHVIHGGYNGDEEVRDAFWKPFDVRLSTKTPEDLVASSP